MSETRQCPQCGTELPIESPEGLCPRCLMQAGLGSQATSGTGVSPADSDSTAAPVAGSDSAARVAPTIRYSPSGRFIPPDPVELAARFPQLEILELLGQGGMGAVYKARQRQLNRIVALKILPFETAGDPAFAERFSREAQALAHLNHPHIVTVHDFGQAFVVPPSGGTSAKLGTRGEDVGKPLDGGTASGTTNGLYYFVMEFVDGANLRRMLESGHLSPREALAIVPQICDALQYAHDEGVVHRDIKPENILIDKKGRVKIADFGLAKLMGGRGSQPRSSGGATPDSLERLTYTNQVMGTPHYIAPEQIERPQTVDHRADIYSLGVVFYEMLTGELPLGRFAPPSQKVQVDVRLDEVVLRSLEKEPERRYQQASQVKTDVEHISRSAPPPVPVRTPPEAVPNTSPAGPTELELAEARAQVRGPAIGLLVTGIIHCLLFPLVLLVGLSWMFGKSSSPKDAEPFGAGDPRIGIDGSLDRTTGVLPGSGRGGLLPERPDATMTRNLPDPLDAAKETTPRDRGGDR